MIGCACSLCTIRSFAGFVIGELSAFVIFYYPSAGTEPSSPRNRCLETGGLFISMAASLLSILGTNPVWLSLLSAR